MRLITHWHVLNSLLPAILLQLWMGYCQLHMTHTAITSYSHNVEIFRELSYSCYGKVDNIQIKIFVFLL